MGPGRASSLSLKLNTTGPYVSGEVLQGEVHLHFPKFNMDDVEKLTIKLSGSIHTRITRENANSTSVSRQEVVLARSTILLWQKGCAYPSLDSQILVLPFGFKLPAGLPPSHSCTGSQYSAKIEYGLHVLGERPGTFRRDRKIHLPLIVVPAHEQGAHIHSAIIAEGWQGGWRAVERRAEIRRQIWGPYSEVHATLLMPDIDYFPTQTPLPFELNIVTHTQPMKRDSRKDSQPIFPAPPSDPRELAFWITPQVEVHAQSRGVPGIFRTKIKLGGFGHSSEPGYNADVQVERIEREWVPLRDSPDEKKSLGQWRQEVTFKSRFTVKAPPTFTTETLLLWYNATMKIPFPGVRNDIKFEFPFKIVSHLPPPGTAAT
ncbi:hypothetical protein PHLGIDRAFT_109000 [Phlebiopsis gigantea 11061_1 CR5-6]|uniref:Arrestin-like N-terminal domain-containing protein n=1 Tax=Phlebiopsis gigantea (strain 11061_1 CR5-6) TaxID=745531 RepID=A0A0C3S7S5_PHLG1|nr:hypothetical protein PHLGIDRAFT_109000 [Phlebiopsis gigantea 11061_1 CR5-6]